MGESMRRNERKISDQEAREILQKGEFGILSMCTADNEGYGVPLNYVLTDDCIYFHCAVEGSKLDYLRNNNKVSFCVTGNTEILPSDFGTLYESCIVSGVTSFADGDEKREALVKLIEKYSKDYIQEGVEYINRLYERVLIIRLSIKHLSGKARKQ